MRDRYVVVADTNILLQSLLNDSGPAAKCIGYFRRGEIDLAVSRDTINEAKDVLSRSSLRNRYSQITDEKVTHLFDFLRYRGMYFQSVKHWFEYPRDPDDEPYINLAIEAEADFIISRDSDLLDLMNWDQSEGRAFQRRFRSLKIVSPIEFLEMMEK